MRYRLLEKVRAVRLREAEGGRRGGEVSQCHAA